MRTLYKEHRMSKIYFGCGAGGAKHVAVNVSRNQVIPRFGLAAERRIGRIAR